MAKREKSSERKPISPLPREVLWATYEGNVQEYRGIALTVQSILLAVGAVFVVSSIIWPTFVVAVLSQVATWLLFFPVIAARTRIADFYKFDLGRRFDNSGRPLGSPSSSGIALTDGDYAKTTNWAIRRRMSAVQSEWGEYRATNWGRTRIKLDLLVPLGMTAIWAMIVTVGVYLTVTGGS